MNKEWFIIDASGVLQIWQKEPRYLIATTTLFIGDTPINEARANVAEIVRLHNEPAKKNPIRLLWEYLFDPWDITVEKQGSESWTSREWWETDPASGHRFIKEFVLYRYTHRFNNKTKLKKVYINEGHN